MTTLPQTTHGRLPRSAPTAIAPTQGMALGHSATAGAPMNGADIWRVLRTHAWLILITLMASIIVGYFANSYLAKYYSRYTATGYVQIQPPTIGDPLKYATQGIDINALAYEQRTQAQLLKHESLITEVLQNANSPIRDTTWFHQFPDIQSRKDNLRDNLAVVPILDSKLIAVSMTYSVSQDCRVIVDEIVEAHLRNERQKTRAKQSDRTMMLDNMKTNYEIRVRNLSQELREKAATLNLNGMGTPGRLGAKELEMSNLVNNQMSLQLEATKAKTMYDSVSSQLQNGVDPAIVETTVSQDPEVMRLQAELDQADQGYSELSARMGAENPTVMQARARVDRLRQKFDDARQEASARRRVEFVDNLRGQAQETQQALDNLNERIKSVKSELGDLSNGMNTYLTVKDEEQADRELLKEVNDQLDSIYQMRDQADMATVAWATHPPTPDTPSFPKLSQTMPAAVALGLALSIGFAFLREMTDTSVRSPRDIARVGQINLLGMVVHQADDPQAEGARLPLVIFEAPQSMLAEQLRQVRTRLQHAASLDTTRTLLVTSPTPQDGKTTIACNLAAGLALNGRRILLVDANFRRPELHNLFAVTNDHGFSDVLNNIENFENAVLATTVPNLSILPCGPKPINPTELLESQLLVDFLERALEDFDHVIFDTGPLLFSSETIALAPRVDGVVTVVRARSNSRGVLQRTRDTLRQVKAEHLGVVLNAVRSTGGGYYGRNIKTYYAYQNGQS